MNLVAATRVVVQLCRAELSRDRRLWLAAGLFALPALAAALLAATGRWGAGVFEQLLKVDLTFLVPFLPATLLGPAIADELERGTAGFIFVRPAPRAALLLGRLAAVLPALLASATSALIIGFVALYLRYPSDLPGALPQLGAALFSVTGGLILYSLVSLGLGATFRRRPVASLLVVFLVDGGLAHAPLALRLLSPAHHLRAVGGLPDGGIAALPFSVPIWGSALYLIVLIAAAAAFGLRRVEQLELTGEAG